MAKRPAKAPAVVAAISGGYNQRSDHENRCKEFLLQVPAYFKTLSKADNSHEVKQVALNNMFEILSNACNSNPRNSQAFFFRGRAYLFMQEYKRALYDFSAAIQAEYNPNYTQDPVSETGQPYHSKESRLSMCFNYCGMCNHALGQFEEAKDHYAAAEKHINDLTKKHGIGLSNAEEILKADILYNKGQTFSSMAGPEDHEQRLNDAIRCFEGAAEVQKLNSVQEIKHKTLFNLGIAFRRAKQPEKSVNVFKEAAKCGTAKAATLNNWGLSLFDSEDWEGARDRFDEAIRTEEIATDKADSSDLAFYHNNLGLCFYHLSRNSEEDNNIMEQALVNFGKAINLNSNNPIHYFNRGNVYLNMSPKRFDRAHADYDAAIELDEIAPKFYHAKGLAYQTEADEIINDKESELELVREAIDYFGKAWECSDTFYAAIFHQGLMFRRIHNFKDAVKMLTKVQLQFPDDKTILYERGLVYQMMGNHDRAIMDFEAATTLDKQYSDALFACGTSRLQRGLTQEDFRIQNIGEVDVSDALGEIKKEKMLSIAQAKADFQKALSYKDDAGLYDGIAQCHSAQGAFDDAITFFGDAIEKDKENVCFLRHRADTYCKQRIFKKALEDLESALVFSREDEEQVVTTQILYQLGGIYFQDKKYRKCLKKLKEALRLLPYPSYEPDIYYHIGLSYARLEKFEKSIFPFSKCIERIPTEGKYIHERAKAHQMIGMHEEAIKDFNALLKRNPSNAHAYFRRAFSLKAIKKFAEAADDFQKAQDLDDKNPLLVVNHKKLKSVECIVLCEPGEEKLFPEKRPRSSIGMMRRSVTQMQKRREVQVSR